MIHEELLKKIVAFLSDVVGKGTVVSNEGVPYKKVVFYFIFVMICKYSEISLEGRGMDKKVCLAGVAIRMWKFFNEIF